MKKIIITIEVDANNISGSAQVAVEETVRETLEGWGYKVERLNVKKESYPDVLL